jgi:hypothetical protein
MNLTKKTIISGMIIYIFILSAGCLEENNGTGPLNESSYYEKVEYDCPEYYEPALYSDGCQSILKNASWKPALIFDSETSDDEIQEIMIRYFGNYDDEWTILDGSSEFPYYLDSPRAQYNYYTSLIKENWGLHLNCHYGCYDEGIIEFEKERDNNVILGLDNCPISHKNCFEEMKKAGIPVKRTKTAFTKKYTADNSNEEMIILLEEINEDEDVLFVHKAYLAGSMV